MIERQTVEALIQDYLDEKGLFLIDLQISKDNRIVLEMDNDEGIRIEDCIALTKFIESKLDREVEDYELEVASAGIGGPFKHIRQYKKNIGEEIEVLAKDGKKYKGILKEVNDNDFTLTVEKQVKPEGAKRKITVEEDLIFPYDGVKYAKYIIRFK